MNKEVKRSKGEKTARVLRYYLSKSYHQFFRPKHDLSLELQINSQRSEDQQQYKEARKHVKDKVLYLNVFTVAVSQPFEGSAETFRSATINSCWLTEVPFFSRAIHEVGHAPGGGRELRKWYNIMMEKASGAYV